MAECKYPNAVCVNMTILNNIAYCDAEECSHEETDEMLNIDVIKQMSCDEFAEFLAEFGMCTLCVSYENCRSQESCASGYMPWLRTKAINGKLNMSNIKECNKEKYNYGEE